MKDKLEQIGKLFAENENAEATLKSAKTVEEAVALLKELGVDITVEEFKELGKEITSDELSEDMLAMVSGGSWKGFWRGVRDFFQGFLDSF